MANTLDLLTLAEAKQALNLSGTTAHDAELPGWITAVSQRLDELVGPVVQRTVTTERHNGGVHRIFLRNHPNTSITSVTEYAGTTGTALAEETNASKPNDAYLVEPYEADPAYLSSIVRRRSSDADTVFAPGRLNVEFTYVAGRFLDTASVAERFKTGARLTLQNLWRSQQEATGTVGEYDVPQNIFPRVTVPTAVRDMFDGEIQDPLPL